VTDDAGSAPPDGLYAELARRTSDLAVVMDPVGRLSWVSPAVRHLLGYAPEELVSESAWDFVHPDDLRQVERTFGQAVASAHPRQTTLRVRAADSSWRFVDASVANLLGTSVDGLMCTLRDVTEKVETEHALRNSERLYRAIVETSTEGLWAVHRDGRTLHVNARMAEILGRPLSELRSRPAAELLTQEQSRRMQARLAGQAPPGVERYEVSYQHPVHGERLLSVAATSLEGPDGGVEASLAMVSDVTEARRTERELRHAALHDSLTGLPNRTLLLDRLEHALARESTATAVAFVDLDNFKLVNDSRGHDVGDELLVAVANRLSAAARPADTIARFGGDEFVVVLDDVDASQAEALVQQLLSALDEPFDVGHGPVHVRASTGLAVSPPKSPTDLLRFADTAMYAAKAAGKGRVRRFDLALGEQAEQSYAMGVELRATLAAPDSGLTLHYQPVVDLDSGQVLGLEALARWEHPTRGTVSPAVFVPVAEQAGLAPELDRWVLQHALSEAAALRAEGVVPPTAYIAVNLSAAHLGDRSLEQQVLAATSAAGLQPASVVLEITEGAIMDDAAVAVALLRRLRDHGFGVAIDDFGTGYSSLAYLRQLPVTALKIDQSFVAHITEDSDALAIVASIVDLARAVGVTVVAEGVESGDQAALLRKLRCAAGQGWLWARAEPADQLRTGRPWQLASAAAEPATTPRRRARMAVGPEHGRDAMLALHREGASLATIAAALNRAGYRTPTGPRWHAASVARAITDVTYPTLTQG
jgi:diguanylate cyclase (GGDEF)-like protein/PAS domain S-box-containing protein